MGAVIVKLDVSAELVDAAAKATTGKKAAISQKAKALGAAWPADVMTDAVNDNIAKIEKHLLAAGFRSTKSFADPRPRRIDEIAWQKILDVEAATGVSRVQLLRAALTLAAGR